MKDYKYKKNKISNLFNETDINKNSIGFINRNLNDTRYVTSLILNDLKYFFENKKPDVKVFPINGKVTNLLRKFYQSDKPDSFFAKDREKSHDHHAIDAALVAFASSPNSKIVKLVEKSQAYSDGDQIMSVEENTGEIARNDGLELIFGKRNANFVSSLKNTKVNLTYKEDPKVNIQISNDTR
jgi:CRISPR-associated endonuclease Csn1